MHQCATDINEGMQDNPKISKIDSTNLKMYTMESLRLCQLII